MSRQRFVMPYYPPTQAKGTVGALDDYDQAYVECDNKIPQFKTESQNCFDWAAKMRDWFLEEPQTEQHEAAWAQFGCNEADTFATCEAKMYRDCVEPLMEKYGCYGTGTGERIDDPWAGMPACASYESKYAAQAALKQMGLYKDTLDGKWGKNSQAALEASGKKFQDLVPGCTGPAPSYGGTGGGTTPGTGGGGTTPGTGGGGQPVVYGDKKDDEGTSPWLWVGLGALAVVGVGIWATSKGAKENPVGIRIPKKSGEEVQYTAHGKTLVVRRTPNRSYVLKIVGQREHYRWADFAKDAEHDIQYFLDTGSLPRG